MFFFFFIHNCYFLQQSGVRPEELEGALAANAEGARVIGCAEVLRPWNSKGRVIQNNSRKVTASSVVSKME